MEKDNFFKKSLRLFLDKIMRFLFKRPAQQKSSVLEKEALSLSYEKHDNIIKNEGVLYYGSINTKISTAESNSSLFTKHQYGKAPTTETIHQMSSINAQAEVEAVSFAQGNHHLAQTTNTVIVPQLISVTAPEQVVVTEEIKPLVKKFKPTLKKMSIETLDKPVAKKAKPSKPLAIVKTNSAIKKPLSKQKDCLRVVTELASKKETQIQASLPKLASSSKKIIQKKIDQKNTESKSAEKPYQRDETLQDIDSVLA
jgi:hypothetical protein